MQLESFDVRGFRSLGDVRGIPLRSPTILTGHNDSGKSASLCALAFLLNRHRLTEEDRTFAPTRDGVTETQIAGSDRVSETTVTGTFTLSEEEVGIFGLPDTIRLRRRATGYEVPVYEVLRRVPADADLRGIQGAKREDLKALASKYHVEPNGPLTQNESWRKPLLEFAAQRELTDAWVPVDRALIERLPTLVSFSSTEEPDPEAQVRAVLQVSFERMLDDAEVIEPIRDVEKRVIDQLQADAVSLCDHIKVRCPELTSVTAVPEVSFRHGFTGVRLRAARGGDDVGLRQSGAGRLRRITLAVWEWTSHLLSTDKGQSVVIVYDEPDTHLDYARQREFMELIRSQCGDQNVRMIVATHSLNLIDRVEIADVVHLLLQDNRTIVERLTDEGHDGIEQYLEKVSAALGLRTSVLLHERCFLAVEGATEQMTFPVLFRLVYGKPIQSAGIALISCDGNTAALKFTEYLSARNRIVAFLIDYDSKTGRNKKLFSDESLARHGIMREQVYYIGGPNELEELYTDEQWAETANEAWPRADGHPWVESDIAKLRSETKFSDSLLKTFRLGAEWGPANKQTMNMSLVLRLRAADEVPEKLRDRFAQIATLATGVKPLAINRKFQSGGRTKTTYTDSVTAFDRSSIVRPERQALDALNLSQELVPDTPTIAFPSEQPA